ncbi:hypothetical protein THAOC_10421 [Thalassiosira oceanica]|uniref:Uncharacterized protein n=1 Tax=Thalassiosira oceanica TaxID=159749 RepID=K0TD20_THAOC|nr:hypothetical protein THAOC_10421 [Thalassiosira oceanica]|eukprot:EJK68402.1 hypothetical protein THAOC_10421 [Thalassiosira oceanica]
MVPDGHVALQGLSSIPHPTSVAAGFYRSDVINGSGTSAGRARAMGAVIEAPGKAMEELDSPYRRCAGRAVSTEASHVVSSTPLPESVGHMDDNTRDRCPLFRPVALVWPSRPVENFRLVALYRDRSDHGSRRKFEGSWRGPSPPAGKGPQGPEKGGRGRPIEAEAAPRSLRPL